jgi:hypothetical protein
MCGTRGSVGVNGPTKSGNQLWNKAQERITRRKPTASTNASNMTAERRSKRLTIRRLKVR